MKETVAASSSCPVCLFLLFVVLCCCLYIVLWLRYCFCMLLKLFFLFFFSVACLYVCFLCFLFYCNSLCFHFHSFSSLLTLFHTFLPVLLWIFFWGFLSYFLLDFLDLNTVNIHFGLLFEGKWENVVELIACRQRIRIIAIIMGNFGENITHQNTAHLIKI